MVRSTLVALPFVAKGLVPGSFLAYWLRLSDRQQYIYYLESCDFYNNHFLKCQGPWIPFMNLRGNHGLYLDDLFNIFKSVKDYCKSRSTLNSILLSTRKPRPMIAQSHELEDLIFKFSSICLQTSYKRNVPSVSRFRFTRIVPRYKESIKICLFNRREPSLR